MNCLRGKYFRLWITGFWRMSLLLFLLLPALASCHITITIQVSNYSSTAIIGLQGDEASIITDSERTTFGITDNVLKNAAEKYSGGKPKDVFLHGPTPWNDLYSTYGWKEVQRVLQPTKNSILDVQSENIFVTLKQLDNNSTSSVKFNTTLVGEVENVIKHRWNKAGKLDINNAISYNVNGPVVFTYASPWGMDGIQSTKLKIGSDSNVETMVDPGETVTAALSATKITMTLQIDYTATLRGHVACNYPKRFNGHHFWRYDINSLMQAGSLIRKVNSSEVISVQFYTNANIIVMNKTTNEKISEVPAVLSSY